MLTLHNGQPVKVVLRDSFGVVFHDSLPELFIPVGFAGGLYDADTGLTRFGFRDYDPQIGRFTARDPLGDTGGIGSTYKCNHKWGDYHPAGLHAIMNPTVARWIGRQLAKIPFEKVANEPEEIVDVRRRIDATERKIKSNTATKDETSRLQRDMERENVLWGKYGKMYSNDKTNFYRHHFPDDDYVKRKMQEIQNR